MNRTIGFRLISKFRAYCKGHRSEDHDRILIMSVHHRMNDRDERSTNFVWEIGCDTVSCSMKLPDLLNLDKFTATCKEWIPTIGFSKRAEALAGQIPIEEKQAAYPPRASQPAAPSFPQPLQMASHRIVRTRQLLWSWLFLLLVGLTTSTTMAEEVRGGLVVIGRGPERQVIEQLAHTFEKAHIGTVIDIMWNRNIRPVDMVKAEEADLAVGGWEEADLTATKIAWDGLAVIVNFSNPIKELTKLQVASLFSGKILDWSELDEKADGKVRVVLRSDDQNLTDGFEQSLGIVGSVAKNGERIRSDQQVLSRVSGELDGVGYLSLKAALDAVSYGISVRVLLVDGIEPGTPTVQSGQYPLKRPVVLLMRRSPTALARAFVDFALSPTGQRILGNLYVPLAQ